MYRPTFFTPPTVFVFYLSKRLFYGMSLPSRPLFHLSEIFQRGCIGRFPEKSRGNVPRGKKRENKRKQKREREHDPRPCPPSLLFSFLYKNYGKSPPTFLSPVFVFPLSLFVSLFFFFFYRKISEKLFHTPLSSFISLFYIHSIKIPNCLSKRISMYLSKYSR